jgi:hypothetical protein
LLREQARIERALHDKTTGRHTAVPATTRRPSPVRGATVVGR